MRRIVAVASRRLHHSANRSSLIRGSSLPLSLSFRSQATLASQQPLDSTAPSLHSAAASTVAAPAASTNATDNSKANNNSRVVYNVFSGRAMLRSSPLMKSFIDAGIDAHPTTNVLCVTQPEVFNAFAQQVRAGSAAFPDVWAKTMQSSVRPVLYEADPAAALQKYLETRFAMRNRRRQGSFVVDATSNAPTTATTAAAAPSSSSAPQHQVTADGSSDKAEEATPNVSTGEVDDVDSVVLNSEQEAVIAEVLRGRNVYIGGSAGTGKTVLLRVLRRRLAQHKLRVAMCATTGIASCHIGGSTFHHAFGITHFNEFVRKSEMMKYDVCIIDEASMLSKTLFEQFDTVLREETGNLNSPFGGMQIVLCGDFLQLGAVNERPLLESPLFHQQFVTMRLEKQVRQEAHPEFAQQLQKLRRGQLTDDLQGMLQTIPAGTLVENAVNLLPTNAQVKAANDAELARLPGETLTLTPHISSPVLEHQCTPTVVLRTLPTFNAKSLQDAILSTLGRQIKLPRRTILSLYKLYDDAYALRCVLPEGESEAWREAMKARFLELIPMIRDWQVGATVVDVILNGSGLHTPENEELLLKYAASHPTAQATPFKIGARVLLRANITNTLVNGSIGVVRDFVTCDKDTVSNPAWKTPRGIDRVVDTYHEYCLNECGMAVPLVPVVEFANGETVVVPPWEFSIGGTSMTNHYSLVATCVPLTLAYAFTVHRVQGLTLVGRVHLELSKMWPCDHLIYVAMSRVKNPEQLSVSAFDPKMIVANSLCVEFDEKLTSASEPHRPSTATLSSWKFAEVQQASAQRNPAKSSVTQSGANDSAVDAIQLTEVEQQRLARSQERSKKMKGLVKFATGKLNGYKKEAAAKAAPNPAA